MVQIIGYVSEREAEAFQRYAESFHLNSAPVATLLLSRELRLKRLQTLIHRYAEERSGGDRKKIISHQSTDALKVCFKDHAAKYGLKPTTAAALIFRAELEEQWLSTAVEARNFDSA